MGVGGQRHAPVTLPLGNRPINHYIGGWVGHRAGLDGCENSPPPPGFDPQTVQPMASPYTDCALPALSLQMYICSTVCIEINIPKFLETIYYDVKY
jgi:hypothetical protein